jgi:hypothetical protein
LIVVSEMARELGERLLAALRRVEQLYEGSAASTSSAEGDPSNGRRPRPGEDVQALDNDGPPTPGEGDPPFGHDRRYWLDVTKIIHVPAGQLAPAGTIEIGPGLYYPAPSSPYTVTPPPPAAKYPLDVGDIVTTRPGQLGPATHQQLIPGVWVPDPAAGYQPSPPWAPPQQPIDVRDIIHVPQGQLAPRGYVEYLPEWWAREPSFYPAIPLVEMQ